MFEDQAQAESFCFANEAVNHSLSAIIQPIKTMAGCVTSVTQVEMGCYTDMNLGEIFAFGQGFAYHSKRFMTNMILVNFRML